MSRPLNWLQISFIPIWINHVWILKSELNVLQSQMMKACSMVFFIEFRHPRWISLVVKFMHFIINTGNIVEFNQF